MGSGVIGLITARGGSKGIPRKNIKMLADKPLIAWTIETARHSRHLDRVIVSTDDEEIARVAREWKAEVPFIRPAELARDDSSHISVVLHALKWLEENEHLTSEYVMLLQPTSPLRTAQDIDAVIDLAVGRNADSVTSVCEMSQHPYWAIKLEEDGSVTSFHGADLRELQEKYPRRQDLPPAYSENGAIYLAKSSVVLEQKTMYGKRLCGYVMPSERSIDIDTPIDFMMAELVLREMANAHG